MGAAASHMAVAAGSCCQEAIIHLTALPPALPSPFMALSAAPSHPGPSELCSAFHLNFLLCHLSSLQLFCLIKFMRVTNAGPLYSPRAFFLRNLLHFMALSLCSGTIRWITQGRFWVIFWLCEGFRARQKFCEWFDVKHLICKTLTFIFSSEDLSFF